MKMLKKSNFRFGWNQIDYRTMKGVMQDEPSGNKQRFKESVKIPIEPPRRNKKNDSSVELASKNRMTV